MDKNRKSGRPPKFDEARSPVTMTLPHRTLEQLATVDQDRARAIVKCVDAVVGDAWPGENRIEIVKAAAGTALIVVGPSRCLRRIPWLRLVEIAPCRYLMTIPSGTAVGSLELAIMDLIEHLPRDDAGEMPMLMELRQRLTHQRRKDNLSKGEVLFVDIE